MTRAKHEPGEIRAQKILQAALPLFGKKGFAATTTREISHAAGVSDALIYKYFPSKAAIYKALVDLCTGLGEGGAEKLKELEPSTETFIKSIYFLFYMVIVGAPNAKKIKPYLDRFLLQSLSGDGAFAKGFHDSKVSPWLNEILKGGFAAAEKSGDIDSIKESPLNRIWFAYHIAFNLLLFQVPKTTPAGYEGDFTMVFNEAVLFALRGVGVKQQAIKKHFNADALNEFVETLLGLKGMGK